mmetsp:Transcript_3588/g.12592  ORF Transcript_3588/g.12592 Transcript_3588/m.12592 type:complete len:261 (-) Transcript_3588:9-791(-)
MLPADGSNPNHQVSGDQLAILAQGSLRLTLALKLDVHEVGSLRAPVPATHDVATLLELPQDQVPVLVLESVHGDPPASEAVAAAKRAVRLVRRRSGAEGILVGEERVGARTPGGGFESAGRGVRPPRCAVAVPEGHDGRRCSVPAPIKLSRRHRALLMVLAIEGRSPKRGTRGGPGLGQGRVQHRGSPACPVSCRVPAQRREHRAARGPKRSARGIVRAGTEGRRGGRGCAVQHGRQPLRVRHGCLRLLLALLLHRLFGV